MHAVKRWLWRLVGLLVVLLGAGLVFVTADARLGRVGAWLLVAAVGLVVPALLAKLLLGAFRRLDAGAGLLESTAGMMVVCAIGAMVALGLVWRGELSSALRAVPERHTRVPAFAGRLARLAGRWIEPAPPAKTAPRARPEPTKTATKTPTKAPAPAPSPPSPPPVSPRAVADAGTDGALPDGGVPVPVIPTIPEPEGLTAETVRVCDEGSEISDFWAVDLGGPVATEIVVLCEREYFPTDVRVLWLTEDGRLTERTRVVAYAPEDLVLYLRDPRVVDLDEDGLPDLLLCAFYTNQRQGPRGGDTWWARGARDGQFLPPTRLVGSSCVGIDAGDIDGDRHPELVVVHMGNPWFEARPEGEVRWYERTNRQFRLRGRKPVLAWPDGLGLSDVNGDGNLDALVHHEDGRGTVVCPGTARGLDPMDPSLRAELPDPLRIVDARLDGDEMVDRIETIVGGSLQLRRSAPPGRAGETAARSLDFREYVLGTPPPAPVEPAAQDVNAGADGGRAEPEVGSSESGR